MQETIKTIQPAEAVIRRTPTQWKIVSLNDELTIVFPDQENRLKESVLPEQPEKDNSDT